MIHSMTGFARSETETDGRVLVWELRSVNHRYLDMSLRIPEALRALEPELRKTVETRLRRGRLEATLRLERGQATGPDLELDPAAVETLAEVLSALGERIPAARSPSLGELIRWPELVRRPEPETAVLMESAREGFAQALDALVAHRAREGERMDAMLRERARDLAEQVAKLREHIPEVREALRRKYHQRLAELDIEADPARLEQELAFAAQKLDVAEELDRLDSHVQEVLDVLERDEAVGRRLDFLMQEFNREANTLSSKSQDPQTTNAAVEMKVLVEQMREQVQNIE